MWHALYNSLQDPNLLDATECPLLLLHRHIQVPNTSKPSGRISGFATGASETELTISPALCTVISLPVGSKISSTFVPLGVVIIQLKGVRFVLGTHIIVTMAKDCPGSTHKSQPISMSLILKNSSGSNGGGWLIHSRMGGPVGRSIYTQNKSME